MGDMYLSGKYVEKNPTYHIEDLLWKAHQILRMIEMHNLQPSLICEIGCGAGEILHQLQPNFPNEALFYGYEISPKAIELCKQRENRHLRFFNQDLLAIETNLFDLMLCIDVFEHVEDYMGFLRKLRKKAIYKIFHIPLEMTLLHILRYKNLIKSRTQAGHLHFFSKETALLTLEDIGYEVLDWFYTPFGIERATTPKARLLQLPRRIFSLINIDLSIRVFGGYSLLVLAK